MLQVGVCHMLKLGWWENHRLLNIKDAKKKKHAHVDAWYVHHHS
jgi:hypothetical protein